MHQRLEAEHKTHMFADLQRSVGSLDVNNHSSALISGCMGVYVYSLLIHSCTLYTHLLDIPRQPTCMKLGTISLYNPTCASKVHTHHLPRDIQQICCSTQTGQHSPLQGSCCPVWALQHIYTHTHRATNRRIRVFYGIQKGVCTVLSRHSFRHKLFSTS